MIFSGKIKEGKFNPDDGEFKFKLRRYENKPVFIEIKPITGKRKTEHNSYYWLLLGIVENETGQEAEDWHNYFKIKTWGYSIIAGEKIPPPSKDRTTIEFMGLVQTVKDFFKENGWIIPEKEKLGEYSK